MAEPLNPRYCFNCRILMDVVGKPGQQHWSCPVCHREQPPEREPRTHHGTQKP